ncbi:MAG: HD domain-containing protein [Chloroflexota bacterium]
MSLDWEVKFRDFVVETLADADRAHTVDHIERVVANARQLCEVEGADRDIVMPAAWLHDCVVVPKNSPNRSKASRLAAEKAGDYLTQLAYPLTLIPHIKHAIEAHSFSAGIPPKTLEAQVVQDADRLDSIGAIGVARCLLTGVSFDAQLYDRLDPFAEARPLDDKAYSIDHFEVKLFKLAGMMQTAAGRIEAERRTTFMRAFIDQLKSEIKP